MAISDPAVLLASVVEPQKIVVVCDNHTILAERERQVCFIIGTE